MLSESMTYTELIKKVKEQAVTYREMKSGKEKLELKSEIERNGRELISRGILSLISSSQGGDIFYGEIIMQITKDVKLGAGSIPNAMAVSQSATGINLHVNPIILIELIDTPKQIIAILIHECLHILFLHLRKYKNIASNSEKKRKIINYGLDVTINQMIENLPEGALTIEWMEETVGYSVTKNEDSNYYIKLLTKHFDKEEENNQNGKGNGGSPNDNDGDGDGQSQQGSGNEENKSDKEKSQIEKDIEDEVIGRDSLPHGGTRDENMHNTWENTVDGSGSDDIDEITKSVLQRAYDEVPTDKRGNLPGYVTSTIDKLSEPSKTNWKSVVKQRTGNLSVPFKQTKKRLNRRQPYRANLSGRITDRTVSLTIAVDTSGSMSNDVLAYCYAEIKSILSAYKLEITVIECDSQIQKVYREKDITKIQSEFKGRGGTSFQPIFDYIRDNRYRNDTHFTIILTDGGGEHEVKTYGYKNVLWLILDTYGYRSALSVENPVGIVAKLSDDKKYELVNKNR